MAIGRWQSTKAQYFADLHRKKFYDIVKIDANTWERHRQRQRFVPLCLNYSGKLDSVANESGNLALMSIFWLSVRMALLPPAVALYLASCTTICKSVKKDSSVFFKFHSYDVHRQCLSCAKLIF